MDTTKRLLALGDDPMHVVGDAGCPRCVEGYPEPCPCGGLLHGGAGEADAEGTEWPDTLCDRCGRSEETVD